MREQADRFAYRAQVLQRGLQRHRGRFGAALGSWFLDLISGYGYRPMRSFITYRGRFATPGCGIRGMSLATGDGLSSSPHHPWYDMPSRPL